MKSIESRDPLEQKPPGNIRLDPSHDQLCGTLSMLMYRDSSPRSLVSLQCCLSHVPVGLGEGELDLYLLVLDDWDVEASFLLDLLALLVLLDGDLGLGRRGPVVAVQVGVPLVLLATVLGVARPPPLLAGVGVSLAQVVAVGGLGVVAVGGRRGVGLVIGLRLGVGDLGNRDLHGRGK